MTPKLLSLKKIYMIGIKGVGMTMLAQYLHAKGIEIIGSDVPESFMTNKVLNKLNIKVYAGFDSAQIPNDADIIIHSTAYNKENNVELAVAIKENKKIYTYAEALGQVFSSQYGIAVIGTHGKTTTTAWLGLLMQKASLSPSVMVGAYVKQFQGSSLVGDSDYLLIEADEYQNKLQYFDPQIVLMNNIDYDHPDFFHSKKDYTQVFVDYIKKIPKKGILVTNYDDKIIRSIAKVNCRARVVTYAINNNADYIAYNIKTNPQGQIFKVKLGSSDFSDIVRDDPKQQEMGEFSIKLLGKHNISNALAVIAAGIELNIDLAVIREGLSDFTGADRRMELMGVYHSVPIIDDYAHHPTEIKTTIKAINQAYPQKNIRLVFHPHTFTRTKAFLDDFAVSFKSVNEVIILDIYGSAREEQGGVHSRDLLKKIKAKTPEIDVVYKSTLSEAEEYLRETLGSDDVVVLMGAGDVFRIGQKLLDI